MFETKLGFAAIAWNDAGVTRFNLPGPKDDRHKPPRRRDAGRAAAAGRGDRRSGAALFRRRAHRLRRHRARPSSVEPFRRSIYDALRKVGFGETVTYGELAKRVGANQPQAAQDVGVAMARNPVPLIIPCHRVLAAGGKLGGFSAPGRTETKEKMLALEGVFIGKQPRLL